MVIEPTGDHSIGRLPQRKAVGKIDAHFHRPMYLKFLYVKSRARESK